MQDELNQLSDPKTARFGAVPGLASRTMAEAMKVTSLRFLWMHDARKAIIALKSMKIRQSA
ncbi:hypothetical protein [Jannaschia helgolandensis]|uniref:hypothetical protein n=1 Tax=Jannaschia helgolandensis TaxID=188906 RepID=UPI0030DDCAD4|tara:strand:+ start:2053 stop:2235 length:183 start_codon:yes stop_codon:yes gene_type:complete